MELKWGKNYPLFSKGGQGGLDNRLIIPLNPPLGKGDLKPPDVIVTNNSHEHYVD